MPPEKRRRDAFTFFVDECLKCSLIYDALQRELLPGEKIKVAAKGTLDEDWLPRAGSAGWICLSKDRRMTVRPNELRAIVNFGVALVTLEEASGSEHARRIVAALRVIRRAAVTLGRAFVVRIDSTGDLTILFEHGKKLPRPRPMKRRIDER